MTIYDALEKCKYGLNFTDEEYDQLAEWLEELKTTRIALEKANGRLEANWKLGYQKAIEDFTEKAKAECRKHYVDCDPYFGGIIDSILYEDDIDEIAEQLKEKIE